MAKKVNKQPDDPGGFEIIGEKPEPRKQRLVFVVLAAFLTFGIAAEFFQLFN